MINDRYIYCLISSAIQGADLQHTVLLFVFKRKYALNVLFSTFCEDKSTQKSVGLMYIDCQNIIAIAYKNKKIICQDVFVEVIQYLVTL